MGQNHTVTIEIRGSDMAHPAIASVIAGMQDMGKAAVSSSEQLGAAARAARQLGDAAGSQGGAGFKRMAEDLQMAATQAKAASAEFNAAVQSIGGDRNLGAAMFPELAAGAERASAEFQRLQAAAREATGALEAEGAAAAHAGSATQSLASSGEQASGGLRSFVGGLTDIAGKAGFAMFGVQQLVGTVTGLAGSLFSGNASMEQTSVAFETMMHSASGAKDMLAQIQTMAAETPFEFPDLAKASQLMLAFGTQAKDVIPTLRIIGDTVSSFGGGVEMMQQIVRVLGQMNTAGKVQAQDMMQLSSLGIAGWNMIADAEGKSVAEIQKMSQEGKLLSSQVVPELLAGMDKAFGGGMQKQAQTFNGMLSTISDNLKSAFRNVSMPFFQEAEGALKQLVDYTSTADFAQTMEDWKSKADDLAHGIRDFVVNDGPMLVSVAQNTATEVVKLADASLRLLDIFHQIADLGKGNAPPPESVPTPGGNEQKIPTPTSSGGGLLDAAKWFDSHLPGSLTQWVDTIKAGDGALKGLNSNWNSSQVTAYMRALDTVYTPLYRLNEGLPPLSENIAKMTGEEILAAAQQERNAAAAREHAKALGELDTRVNGAAEGIRATGREASLQGESISAAAKAIQDYNAWQQELALASRDTAAGLREEARGIRENASVTAQGAGQIAAAMSMVRTSTRDAVAGLQGMQQELGATAGIYSQQASGYKSDMSALTAARDAINEKVAAGLPITAQDQALLDQYPGLIARWTGGVSDATIQEGLAVAAKGDLAIAQENLAKAIANGETNLQPYIDKVQQAKDVLANAQPDSPLAKAMTDLDTTMGGVTQAVNDLVVALGVLDKTNANPTVSLDDRKLAEGEANAHGGLDQLDKREAKPHVGMDNKEYIQRKVELDASLDGLDRRPPAQPKVGMDKSVFDQKSGDVETKVTTTIPGWHGDPHVGLETGAFDSGITHVQNTIDGLKGQSVDIPVNVTYQYQTSGLPPSGPPPAPDPGPVTSDGGGGGSGPGGPSRTQGALGQRALSEMIPNRTHSGGGLPPTNADVSAASDATRNARAYVDFTKELVGLLAQAAKDMGKGAEAAKTYADSAGAALKLISDAADLHIKLGKQLITIGPEEHASITALAEMTAFATQGMADASRQFKEKTLAHVKLYADTAGAIVGVMSSALDFAVKLGDTVVQFGQAQEQAVANLKFLTEKAVVSFGDSAALMDGPYLDHAKQYAESSSAVLGVMSSALQFVKDLGDTTILYGQWQDQAVANLKFITEKAVVSLADSAAMYSTDYIAGVKAYADAAKAASDVLSGALGFVKDLGDTVVLYGQWQEQAIANLKFIAEKAVTSVADSAAYVGQLPAGFKAYTDAIQQSIGALSDTLKFVQALAQVTHGMLPPLDQIKAGVRTLAIDARLIADEFRAAAVAWGTDVDKQVSAFATNVHDSTGTLTEVQKFLSDLGAVTHGALPSAEQVAAYAQQLSDEARVIADAFKAASANWGETANPAIQAFATDAGASLQVLAAVPAALTAIAAFGDEKGIDLPGLAAKMAADIDTMVQAIEKVKTDWESRGAPDIKDFAAGAGQAVSLMQGVASAYKGIAEGARITAAEMGVFKHNWHIVLDLVRDLALDSEPYLNDAKKFAEIAKLIAQEFQDAAKSIQTIAPNATASAAGTAGALSAANDFLSGRKSGGGGGTPTYIPAGAGGKGNPPPKPPPAGPDPWAAIMADWQSLTAGQLIPKLTSEVAVLQEQLKLAIAGGASTAVVDKLKADLLAKQAELKLAGQLAGQLTADGFIQGVKDFPLKALMAMQPYMADFGVGLTKDLVAALGSGQIGIKNAMAFLTNAVKASLSDLDTTNDLTIGKISDSLKSLEQQLVVQLAQAWIAGTDPGPLTANIKAIEALLAKLGAAATQTAATVGGQARVITGALTEMGSGVSVGHWAYKKHDSASPLGPLSSLLDKLAPPPDPLTALPDAVGASVGQAITDASHAQARIIADAVRQAILDAFQHAPGSLVGVGANSAPASLFQSVNAAVMQQGKLRAGAPPRW